MVLSPISNWTPSLSGKMWGGQRIYSEDKFSAVLDTVYQFATANSSQDTDAAEIIVGDSAASRVHKLTISVFFVRLSPRQNSDCSTRLRIPVANASIFYKWNAISHLQSSTGTHTLAELTIMMNQGLTDGLLQTQWDATFKVNRGSSIFFVSSSILNSQRFKMPREFSHRFRSRPPPPAS